MSLRFNPLLLLLPLAALFAGCDKDFDTPPQHVLPVGDVMTIKQLKALYTNAPVHFPTAKSVYATVIADENDGNLYKNVYVQDSTGGICLRLLTSGGLYIGDRIRIYLPGTVLSPYNGLMQLDSVNVDNNTVKQSTDYNVAPRHLTIAEINSANLDTLQSTLVELDSVEFIDAEAAGGQWAPAAGGSSGIDRHLEDCGGDQIVMRMSTYANYASQALPVGKGPIVCVVSLYGSTIQLINRRLSDVHLTGARCPGHELPFFFKNFNDNSVTSGGWTNWSDTSAVNWTTNSIGALDGSYGQVKNYNGSVNIPCETWLISPSIDLSSTTAPVLTFVTGCNYTGSNIQCLVSTDYVSGAPSTGTWTVLPAAVSPGSWTWTNSGSLDLSAYHTANVHIGYKYTGTSSDGKTWELDNIKITDN